MAAGEAKAATRGAGRRTKVKGRIVVTPSRHRPAWGPANGRQTEKEKLAQKKFEREREAAENAVALQAQELEREFEVSSAARDERLSERLKLDKTARGAQRFRPCVDAKRGTRVLGWYDGTPWMVVRDEGERREFFYSAASHEATWSEPPELAAEKHVGESTEAERTDAGERAVKSVARAARRQRSRRKRQCLESYARCVGRLSAGYPDYVSLSMCMLQDCMTAAALMLVAILSYCR